MYVLGYRPAMIQQIELGASAGGTLEAVTPEAITVTSQYEDYYRQETGWSGLLYKSAHAKYAHKLARLDLATPCDMRAPSAPTSFFALECAMDELAVALKLDPLELRLRCYSDRDQHNDRPYSSKNLRECYHQGAEAFGWNKRIPEPRSMRDGTELVGLGMATGVWEALQVPITVRIVLTANGDAEVSCATSDIGTGTYTIMTQVAADMLGLPLDNATIKLGDSTLPQSPVEGGSWIAASASNGIATTSDAVRGELLRVWQSKYRIRCWRTQHLTRSCWRMASLSASVMHRARYRLPMRCGPGALSVLSRRKPPPSPMTAHMRTTPIRRSSPK